MICDLNCFHTFREKNNSKKKKTIFIRIGRFIKDPFDQNTLKITDLQYEDGGTYTCVARTDVDEVRAEATLVVQDKPNRPRIDSVQCTSGSSKNGITPKVKITWTNGGENNAKILHYVLQYNTSFTPNEWIDVMVTAQKEVSASLENQTDQDAMTKLILVRKFESKYQLHDSVSVHFCTSKTKC